MSLSDAEIDALEQLQEAIESGDVSLLRKLLNQTDLDVGDRVSSLATMSRSAGRASSGPGAIMMMSMLSCGAPGGGAR